MQAFIGSNHMMYQAFVPTKNTLDAVGVRVKSEIGATSTVKMEIMDFMNPPYPVIASATKTIGNTEEWVTFDFPDVAMPLSGYVIFLKNVSQNEHAIWKQNNGSCDPRGYAIEDDMPNLSRDFGFAVYAYDSNNGSSGAGPGGNNPPSGGSGLPPASNGSTTSPIGTTAGTQKPPSSQTSSAILPPTNLTATDTELDYGGSIDLGWKTSTSSNIDGYKVFRRAEGDWEYIEILRLPKTFTKFTDPWAEKDKTYYYMLRSYKGSQESANSNIASATSKDDLTGLKKDILDDYKKNAKGGVLGGSPFLIIIPIIIVLMIIGLFILGLWVLFHKKKQPSASPPPAPKEK
jgi:hypothetical protein